VDQEHNPYSPPKANVDVAAPVDLEVVGKGKRFATYLIDYIVINVLMFVLGMAVALLFGDAGVRAIQSINEIVLAILGFIVYYVVFEGVWSRTPAKFLLGTVVVRDDGGKPTFGKIVIRTLSRFIPFEPFSFFGERGWHDGLSDTRVVSTRG
jgi:uncharacterized RDD family membrane protein YckC